MPIEGGLRVRGSFARTGFPGRPLVSIVTVTRNRAAVLEKAIGSVLGQTYGNIEYVVIDGESDDGTVEILKRHDHAIAYWRSETDRNLYDAMNKGIALCTGDIVGIVNSDDWLERDAVEAAVQAFSLNPDVDLVHGNLGARTHDGELECVLRPRRSTLAWYVSLPVYHPTCFLRKRAYSRFGAFNPDYAIVADYELFLRLRKGGAKMLHLDRILSNMTAGGVSNRPENFEKAMKESLQAKLSNGYDPVLSRIGLWLHRGKYRGYRFLKKWKLDHVVDLYRRIAR
jgi:glycosyltransferase involved in cell wall biosynthesis